MTEVGIPVYKARATLPKALDSLLAQTKEMFITCLSIDGDGEDYSDIIAEYTRRGLHIRVINSQENGGPGIARQRILDTTQCEYLIYLDSDDMLMPRAVEILTNKIRAGNLNIIRSAFVREFISKEDQLIPYDVNTITWFHGKIYRVAYLKQNNINFLPGLRTDEDAYFNLVAWNCTDQRGQMEEYTYIWRDNKNSITRCLEQKDYFAKTYLNYIRSQVEGLKKIYALKGEISGPLTSQTLLNIFYYYRKADYYQLPAEEMDSMIQSLKQEVWLPQFLNNGDNWIYCVQHCAAGNIYDEHISFYEETFAQWAKRLLV